MYQLRLQRPLRRLMLAHMRAAPSIRLPAGSVAVRSQRTAQLVTPIVHQSPYRSVSSEAHLPPPTRGLRFDISDLPSDLQREFDDIENARVLKHLAMVKRRLATTHDHQGDSTSAAEPGQAAPKSDPVRILRSSALLVSWKCRKCGEAWESRPRDRADPQVAHFFGCPACHRAQEPVPTDSSVSGPSPTEGSGRDSRDCPARATPPPRLADAYPLIAAQWEPKRNSVIHNRVLFESVADVPLDCTSACWWQCPKCFRPWLESVTSRVLRCERKAQLESSRPCPAQCLTLCPGCEDREWSLVTAKAAIPGGNTQRPVNGTRVTSPKRFLIDDDRLMSEVILRKQDDPTSIPLQSAQRLRWTCSYCQCEYEAGVSNRHLRYEGCPECTGKRRSVHNLLVIQRPDVCKEVSITAKRSVLLKATIHDDTVLPFVCRICLSVYRLPVRVRCQLPPGSVACPKCYRVTAATLNELSEPAPAPVPPGDIASDTSPQAVTPSKERAAVQCRLAAAELHRRTQAVASRRRSQKKPRTPHAMSLTRHSLRPLKQVTTN